MSSAITTEQNSGGKIKPIDFADRLIHLAFTGLWIKDSRLLSASVNLSGIGNPGTNLMVQSFIPPELLNTGSNNLVK